MSLGMKFQREFELWFAKHETGRRISKNIGLQREVTSDDLEKIINEVVPSYEDFYQNRRWSRVDPRPSD